MGNEFVAFDGIPGYDQLEDDEREIEARRILTYSKNALRIGKEVDSICILHPHFKSALEACDRIFQIARELDVAQGLRLVGPPGAGKSTVFSYFKKSLPRSTLFSPEWGCIGIRAYHHTTVGHLVAALLRTYKYPFNRFSEQTVYLRRGLVFELVRQKGTRLIFIDSAHHLLAYGNRRNYDPVGNDFLTELMDETKVGLVLAGSESLASDDHFSKELASRVTALHEIKNFQPTAQWEGLLRALIKACKSVRLDIIVSPGQAKMLHGATGGNLRALKRFLIEVAMICADDAKESVDISHLSIAYTRIVGEASKVLNPYAVQNQVASRSVTA